MPEPMRDADDMRRYANALRLQAERRIEELTRQLADGEISLADWHIQMRVELRRTNLEQFVTGKGGDRAGLKLTDYQGLGTELRRQYRYLEKFARVVKKAADDGRSLNFAISRAKLYAKSSQASFWRSHVPVKLPQVPRDGQTKCRTNCRCRLRIQHEYDQEGKMVAVLVWWQLSPAEHCDDCKKLARTWNPLRIEVADTEESDMSQSAALLLLESPELMPVATELYRILGIKEGEHAA
jgi:hypothetical protein